MRGTTHLLAGLVLATVLTELVAYPRPVLAVLLILLGSLLPDVDERTSILGKRVPLVGRLVKHRSLFHGILLLSFLIAGLSFVLPMLYVWTFAGAYLLHLILDAMTPQGVRPFWPSPLRISGFVRVGGRLEQCIFLAVVTLFFWLLLRRF